MFHGIGEKGGDLLSCFLLHSHDLVADSNRLDARTRSQKPKRDFTICFWAFARSNNLRHCEDGLYTRRNRRFFADQIGSFRNAPNQASSLLTNPICHAVGLKARNGMRTKASIDHELKYVVKVAGRCFPSGVELRRQLSRIIRGERAQAIFRRMRKIAVAREASPRHQQSMLQSVSLEAAEVRISF